MRVKGILLARLLVAASASAVATLPRPDARAGTELGNARFAEYANPLHGIVFRYPEEWNVIDLGNAVNVVGTETVSLRESAAPVSARASAKGTGGKERMSDERAGAEGLGNVESVEIFFDTSRRFPTFIHFERYVRAMRPSYEWRTTKFQGRFAFEARTQARTYVMVLKDATTVMQVSYPLDSITGLPPALVQKTVDSLSFLESDER